MPKKVHHKTFDEAVSFLRSHSFDVTDSQQGSGRLLVRKYGCGALVSRAGKDGVELAGKPSVLVGGEMATLEDRGYQKFFVTPRLTVPATAEHLRSLHTFAEELKEAVGAVSRYNESLGTTSDSYMYDRVKGRA